MTDLRYSSIQLNNQLKRQYTIDRVIKLPNVILTDGREKSLSQYRNLRTRLNFTCPICDEVRKVAVGGIIDSKHGSMCLKCKYALNIIDRKKAGPNIAKGLKRRKKINHHIDLEKYPIVSQILAVRWNSKNACKISSVLRTAA